jgi:biopolymer transport protein ExbB
VLALIEAAGWPIWPLIFASILALAIIIERAYTLRSRSINPPNLLEQTLDNLRRHGISADLLRALAAGSPMGRVFAAGLRNVNGSRELMKEALEETGRAVAHELERYLTALGTIAVVAPLLGLLGTVIGMIEIFGAQSPGGSNPAKLAHGISIALYNTAFGLIVAIPQHDLLPLLPRPRSTPCWWRWNSRPCVWWTSCTGSASEFPARLATRRAGDQSDPAHRPAAGDHHLPGHHHHLCPLRRTADQPARGARGDGQGDPPPRSRSTST